VETPSKKALAGLAAARASTKVKKTRDAKTKGARWGFRASQWFSVVMYVRERMKSFQKNRKNPKKSEWPLGVGEIAQDCKQCKLNKRNREFTQIRSVSLAIWDFWQFSSFLP
jgi:hypothetical protein